MNEKTSSFESAEQPERNLLASFDATVSAIAQIEGTGWETKNREVTKEHTALGVFNWLKNMDSGAKETIKDKFTAIIYGADGINRWLVNGKGEVRFSRDHKRNKESLKRAQELGFEII